MTIEALGVKTGRSAIDAARRLARRQLNQAREVVKSATDNGDLSAGVGTGLLASLDMILSKLG